jgi:hypothetical protein
MGKRPINAGKKWRTDHKAKIAEIADLIKTRADLERIAVEKAEYFSRTSTVVAKRIEIHKGWHYPQDGNKE